MRNYTGTIAGVYYQISYPEQIVFAYNYNNIVLQSGDRTAFNYSIEVSDPRNAIETRTINVASFNGEANANISLLLQMVFVAPNAFTSYNVQITVKKGDQQILQFSTLVLYAVLSRGERLQHLGLYPETQKAHFERHLTWFSHFPFDVSYLALQGYEISTRHDSTPYGAGREITINEITTVGVDADTQKQCVIRLRNTGGTSTFNASFDYTFFRLGKEDTLIYVDRCDNKSGFYFRWLDRRGFWMYYLFAEGKNELKTELENVKTNQVHTIEQYAVGNMFEDSRAVSIDVTRTINCCAVGLNPEQYDDVSSIATAVYVDLFLGYDDTNNHLPIWTPCNVSSSTHAKDMKSELNDFEISVELKETTQRL